MSENSIALKTWGPWSASERRYANVKKRFLRRNVVLRAASARAVSREVSSRSGFWTLRVPLGHSLLQVAERQGISQVPANAEEDDHVLEMPPSEQCWPFSGHDTRYQISSKRICNRARR